MIKNYLKKRFAFTALTAIIVAGSSNAQTTVTFTHTGGMQSFTVPPCVGTMTILAYGASGGTGGSSGPVGANGGAVRGVITATPGQVMHLFVGGQGSVTAGGFNGGGAGGASSTSSGAGGGGASDVRIGGTALTDRIIVAAGGGGGGGSSTYAPGAGAGGGGSIFTNSSGYGGAGATGCASGGNGGESGGTAPSYGSGGGGGGNTSGGGGGGQPSSTTGGYGCAGALGTGGAGGGTSFICGGATGGINGGGGGGGGYYGGGGGMTGTGGCNGGGGGGSSWLSPSLFSTTGFTSGIQSGHGSITLTYIFNGTGVLPSVTSTAICTGSSLTINSTGVVTYTWLPVGTFTGSNASSITVAPTANTIYTVQGTNSLGCVSSAVITVTVDQALPVLTVANTSTATSGVCPSKSVALTASGATTYTWTGNIPVTNGVAFNPATSSGFTVTGGNACGTTTAATSVSVHPAPNVSTVVSQPTVCSGSPVTLSAVGNATAYSWSGGITDGSPFFPQTTGSYTVTGTSAQGCTNTSVAFVTVVTTPVAQPIASPPLICIGSTSTLTATGASSYTWTTPNGTFSTPQITVNPLVTTTYVITKSNANCVNTQSVTVIVNLLPSVSAIATPSLICANRTATLQGGGAQTFTWTAPGPPSFTMTGSSPIVSPSITTIYTVAASDGTCINTTTVQVNTDPNPTITVNSPTMVCQGDPVTLTATGATNGYTWTTPAGTVTGSTINENPTVSFLYMVVGMNSFSCTSMTNQVMVVQPTPTLIVSTNKPLVCSGAASNLTVTGANTYVWDANAGGATSNVVQVNPVSTTVYTVTGAFTTGCDAEKTITVSVFQPTFAVNNPTSSCLGGTVNLIASGALTYTWNGTHPFSQIAVSPTAATIYTVAATSSSLGVNCITSQNVNVSIYANPTITAVAEKTLICKNESTFLSASGGSTYVWSSGPAGQTITVNPQVQTVYQVIGTDQNGCVGSTTVMVRVSTCFGISEEAMSVLGLNIYPNPSTGNFIIKSDYDLNLQVINQLGQVVKVLDLTAFNKNEVNLSSLAAGVYYLTGEKEGVKIHEQIIITE